MIRTLYTHAASYFLHVQLRVFDWVVHARLDGALGSFFKRSKLRWLRVGYLAEDLARHWINYVLRCGNIVPLAEAGRRGGGEAGREREKAHAGVSSSPS